ncbi:MAG: GNAT family N-acetyltransferase [Bacteroidetes bacterium B1(2017)]|nr:MAG: GNAT family N-acetyltransferase [Bacteroidetes bacterium B1(2017)]
MKPIIETERLLLRELVSTDVQAFYELDSNPEVHKYLGSNAATSMEECSAMIEFIQKQYQENGIGRWAMIEKESGHFIGWTGLKLMKTTVNNRTDFLDVGYRLIQNYWGKGYATESTVASLKYAFENLKAQEVIGITHIDNLASRRVLEKCGLKFIETFTWLEWGNTECNWLKISKEEWIAHNEN